MHIKYLLLKIKFISYYINLKYIVIYHCNLNSINKNILRILYIKIFRYKEKEFDDE